MPVNGRCDATANKTTWKAHRSIVTIQVSFSLIPTKGGPVDIAVDMLLANLVKNTDWRSLKYRARCLGRVRMNDLVVIFVSTGKFLFRVYPNRFRVTFLGYRSEKIPSPALRRGGGRSSTRSGGEPGLVRGRAARGPADIGTQKLR